MKDLHTYLDELITKFKPKRANPRHALKLLHESGCYVNSPSLFIRTAMLAVDASVSKKVKKAPGEVLKIPLLNTSIRIGEQLEANFMFNSKLTHEDHIQLGCLFVEALLQCGYITLEYARTMDSSYLVVPEPKWFELWESIEESEANPHRLVGTVFNRPKDLTSAIQNGKTVCKQFSQDDIDNFSSLLDEPFVKGFNKTQQTPWRINTKVLEHARQYYAGISRPPKVFNGGKKPFIRASKSYEAKQTAFRKTKMETARTKWLAERTSQQELSKYLTVVSILAKAEQLKDEERFYSLSYLDFRGRSYYLETFLLYQGCDLARSLLTFEEGMALDYSSLQELKIHTANSYNDTFSIGSIPAWTTFDYDSHLTSEGLKDISVDKMTFKDRSKWVNSNWELILKVAEEGIDALPKDNNGKIICDKPWVFLSCCLELSAWFKNRRTFKSSLPCAIDGMVNALQFMSAISRDEQAGELVALKDSVIPRDLYVEVAKNLVARNPSFFAIHNITIPELRKAVCKIAVMLKAYSAGILTVSEDITDALDTLGISAKYGLTIADQKFLAKESVVSLSEVCPQFDVVLQFLQSIVEVEIGTTTAFDPDGNIVSPYQRQKRKQENKVIYAICKKEGRERSPEEQDIIDANNAFNSSLTYTLTSGVGTKELRWSSPSGFPVVLRNYHKRKVDVYTQLLGANKKGRVHLSYLEDTDRPVKEAFLSGICPNMIHSHDSAQLSITASRFDGPFSGIHDSFSTIAGRMGELRKINKQVFFETYGDTNWFQQIADSLLSDQANHPVVIPDLGTLDLTDVLTSKYFYS